MLIALELTTNLLTSISISFFVFRNPNTSPGAVSLDEWPLHSISHQEYLELNTKYLDSSNKWRAVGKGPRIRECAFWNTYLPNLLSKVFLLFFLRLIFVYRLVNIMILE